jgi:hypothetical protein
MRHFFRKLIPCLVIFISMSSWAGTTTLTIGTPPTISRAAGYNSADSCTGPIARATSASAMRAAVLRWSACSKVDINGNNLKLLQESDVAPLSASAVSDSGLKAALCALVNPVSTCQVPSTLPPCQIAQSPIGGQYMGMQEIQMPINTSSDCDANNFTIDFTNIPNDPRPIPCEVVGPFVKSGASLNFSIYVNPALMDGFSETCRYNVRHNGNIIIPALYNYFYVYKPCDVSPAGYCQTVGKPIVTRSDADSILNCGVDYTIDSSLDALGVGGWNYKGIKFSDTNVFRSSFNPSEDSYSESELAEICGWRPKP